VTDQDGGPPRSDRRPQLSLPVGVGIGSSAGGPRALLTLLKDFALPRFGFAFLVQHIHPKFTRILGRRLNETASIPVVEAEDGAVALPGRLYLAPASRHLQVERNWPATFRTRLTDDPPRHGVRPSVDALFLSLAAVFGPRAIGVVLTGMGRDGLEGARAIKAQGGVVFAEAEVSCVVYGMPRAVAEAGLADRLVPIGEMAGAIYEASSLAADPRSPTISRVEG
jgi:two-component system, chemotaxis family, protein-glutamate methylesterase/glutaminase